MYISCYNETEIENLKLSKFYFYYSLYTTFHIKKGGNYMKYNKYLIITFPILIILVSAFFYTKNIIYFYLTIPICVYVSFVRYFKEKNKLLIKTNKVLNLLNYEFTMYTVAVLTPYSISSFSFIRKIKSVEYAYIGCGISAALLLLTGVIHIKRTLLIRKELRNNNSK